MSHIINPWLVDGFVDDEMTKSVQSAYTGSLDAPQEAILDRKLKAERKARAELAERKSSLHNEFESVVNRIVSAKKRYTTKPETIEKLRRRLFEIKVELERLEQIMI